MRNAFAAELTKAAVEHPEVVLLSGDIGNKLFDSFKEVAPERFFNCGVAEANLISMAAGMAASGLRPIAYTITPFITYRVYEQIRVDVCYHQQPVIIVGVGSGMGYASLGATHHSCEDIAVMRALPHMQVLCPGDPLEVPSALRAALGSGSPTYIRLGKKGEQRIHKSAPDFGFGKALQIQKGKDLCILSTGTILPEACEAAALLSSAGHSVEVMSVPSVKPLPHDELIRIFSDYRVIVSVEEHSRIGGFGAAILEWTNDFAHNFSGRFLRIGTPDDFFHQAGEREDAFELWGLTGRGIATKIEEILR